MTARLTPEEKARRATQRALLKLPPKARFYATAGLRMRTPKETAEYLAFIQKQGEETIARGQRLAAAYAADEVRNDEERLHSWRMRRAGGLTIWKRLRNGMAGASTREALAPPTSLPGATLADKIAAKTAEFYALQERPQSGNYREWRSDIEGPSLPPGFARTPTSKRPWWRFW